MFSARNLNNSCVHDLENWSSFKDECYASKHSSSKYLYLESIEIVCFCSRGCVKIH